MSERTDELRRLLDERGIEWNYGLHGPSFSTEIGTAGNEVTFIEAERGLLCSTYLRPEQIADIFASFGPSKECCGRETCHNVLGERYFVCSECGAFMQAQNTNVGKSYVDEDGVRWYGNSYEHNFNYCPNCGRKVVG